MTMTSTAPPTPTETDVRRLNLEGREILLVGTAHVSRASVDLVRQVIEREEPDCVCVELDERRYQALSQRARWENLDLKRLISEKQLSTLLVNLILAAYQKKLGEQLGVLPGTELLEAVRAAEERSIPVALCDRDVRVTLRRAWYATSFFRKAYLVSALIVSLFEKTELTEEELARLRETDVLSELMQELGKTLPEIKEVVIDERDTYLAEKIRSARGNRVVAVVGAGHVEGIAKILEAGKGSDLEAINTIPPVSPAWKMLGWGIPALIIGALLLIAWRHGASTAGSSLLYWILANGIPCAIGAALALGHPLTIMTGFAAAPVTSLTPVIGAGYVTAFVQVMTRPPVVREFETVLDSMATLQGWWRNKLLRVFLAFLLPGVGSLVGTWIGGYEIFSTLLRP